MSCLDAPTEFDRMTALVRLDAAPDVGPGAGSHTGADFSVDLPDEWLSLVGIHGGYLTSLAVRGAESLVPDRAVRTLTTSFLRVARAGEARLEVREQRRGRSISTIGATLTQDGRPIISTRLTMLARVGGVEWQRTDPILLPPLDACVPIEPPPEAGVRRSHFDRADGVLDPASLPFTDGPRAMVRGYIRPLEPRPVDAAWLAMATDWFPPPAFVSLQPPIGGISVDLVTHIHQTLPDPGDAWLAAEFEIATSAGGLATEHGRITTLTGLVLAESMQTRWTAGR